MCVNKSQVNHALVKLIDKTPKHQKRKTQKAKSKAQKTETQN